MAGKEQFPELPHLIVTPRTLSAQLESEILKYTEKGAFRVIIYSRAIDREAFFGPGGEWETFVASSEHKHRTIVIAEIPVSSVDSQPWDEGVLTLCSRA